MDVYTFNKENILISSKHISPAQRPQSHSHTFSYPLDLCVLISQGILDLICPSELHKHDYVTPLEKVLQNFVLRPPA